MRIFLLFTLVLWGNFPISYAQPTYFPPLTGNIWETASPASLGWCTEYQDSLSSFLESTNTKAFMVLKNGKIAIEWYYGAFTQDSLWYWASAGKSLTGFLVGVAQQQGALSINDPTAAYLGTGWTSCTPAQEAAITIRHQLTMTTGLNDEVPDPDCTTPACLGYKADPATRWAYHNAPYTLLDKVIENATGQSLNLYYLSQLRNRTGMNGGYFNLGFNNVLFTNARSMARFGLLIANKGKWGTDAILTDTAYFTNMTQSSQTLNPAYGYLWWLNGKSYYRVPQSQVVIPGTLLSHAPSDMIAAMGKNGQFLFVVPSEQLVMIRMGNNPDNALVPFLYANDIWEAFNKVWCTTAATTAALQPAHCYPNPATHTLYIDTPDASLLTSLRLYNNVGACVLQAQGKGELPVGHLPKGIYYLTYSFKGQLFGTTVAVQ